jgi:hypothetical protein
MALGIIVGFLLGGFLGYMAGAFVACELLNAGNLWGLFGVFITGPLGGIGGSIAGALLARPRTATQEQERTP